MPNIKSAKKRVKVIETKTLQNKIFKTQLKTDIKKYQAALAAGDNALAQETYKAAVKKILLKYNNRTQLEDFKMHYNELKIITDDYKINISTVTNCTPKSK